MSMITMTDKQRDGGWRPVKCRAGSCRQCTVHPPVMSPVLRHYHCCQLKMKSARAVVGL